MERTKPEPGSRLSHAVAVVAYVSVAAYLAFSIGMHNFVVQLGVMLRRLAGWG
ncbi:MAG: hypothetical protein IOMNBAOH_01002 [Rhodocyclaceae bacterium]|nr:hypothetical protein [Rhodocyclaceae bacterium]MCG3186445.1 hypothetical protein [Rhodocyclaceae bacterium]